ncbi:restriction endonuclease subunit S [Ligilactobacillus apodemi]|nr:restriction endonuclease subunit S [Ligilactobacillus apodemi]MCR1900508.1 restriction endonuclease subunit S [Ligilactobacillus apodemi]
MRRIGECFEERSSRSEKGELISVTINSGIIKASELERKDISSSSKANYKVVRVGDIAYNSMRMWQGASGYSPYDGILSPAYTVLKPKEDIHSKFFAQYFKRSDVIWLFRINSQGLTSDTWNLKFPALSRIYLRVPTINEQIKIAKYFKHLDELITLHQRRSKIQHISSDAVKLDFMQFIFSHVNHPHEVKC